MRHRAHAAMVAVAAMAAAAMAQHVDPDATASDDPACFTNNSCGSKASLTRCYTCCSEHCNAVDTTKCQDSCDDEYSRWPAFVEYAITPADEVTDVLVALAAEPDLWGNAELAFMDYVYANHAEPDGRLALVLASEQYAVIDHRWQHMVHANVIDGLADWHRSTGYVSNAIACAVVSDLVERADVQATLLLIAWHHPDASTRRQAATAYVRASG